VLMSANALCGCTVGCAARGCDSHVVRKTAEGCRHFSSDGWQALHMCGAHLCSLTLRGTDAWPLPCGRRGLQGQIARCCGDAQEDPSAGAAAGLSTTGTFAVPHVKARSSGRHPSLPSRRSARSSNACTARSALTSRTRQPQPSRSTPRSRSATKPATQRRPHRKNSPRRRRSAASRASSPPLSPLDCEPHSSLSSPARWPRRTGFLRRRARPPSPDPDPGSPSLSAHAPPPGVPGSSQRARAGKPAVPRDADDDEVEAEPLSPPSASPRALSSSSSSGYELA
jgi:hypothetical protein